MPSSGQKIRLAMAALTLLLTSSGCVLVAVKAGHESVLVEKPFFFGHGGVEPIPTTTGHVAIAPSTEVADVDMRPLQYSEHFDVILAENAPSPLTRS